MPEAVDVEQLWAARLAEATARIGPGIDPVVLADRYDAADRETIVIDVVERTDGAIRRDEILGRTGMAPRTLDRAVARLEDTGAVRRDRAGDDLRYVQVTLVEPQIRYNLILVNRC